MIPRLGHGLAATALAVATTATGGQQTPANVSEWAKAFAAPAIVGAASDATGRTLAFGRLELKLQTGSLFPVGVADRVVGVYFSGAGALRYTSTDPLEAASYRRNAKQASKYEVGKDGVITDTISSALIVLSSGVEAFTGAAAAPSPARAPTADMTLAERAELSTLEKSERAYSEGFAKHVERFGKDRGLPRYTALMPQAMVDPPAQPVVYAEIVAGKHDLVYALDPMRGGDEGLAVMERDKEALSYTKDRRYPRVLSNQPVGRGRLDPRPRRFVLTAVDLALTNPDGLRAELEVTETFQALAPVRVLDLGLSKTRWASTGATGAWSENAYEVKSVRVASGDELVFAHDVNDDLLVELPRTLAAGESITLAFSISGDVLFRPGGDNYWELGTDNWLPSPNQIEAMAATYHAVVKARKPFIPFSCGQTIRRWQEGELECAEFREEKPIQIPVILAGKYTTTTEERNGVTVRVSAYAVAKPAGVKKLIDLTFNLMEFYKFYLSDYPFKELNIIEINAFGFGQAPAGIIFITQEAFNPLMGEDSRMFSEGVNARVAHELAHAWWGHVAKLSLPENQWLSESTAQYYAAFALQKLGGEKWWNQAESEWKTRARHLKDEATVFTANYLFGDYAGYDRQALLYGKGAFVLHALRQEIGDQAFFTILKSFLKSFYFKPAETRHFIGLTNYVTKKDYTDWFNRYLLGTEWPKL